MHIIEIGVRKRIASVEKKRIFSHLFLNLKFNGAFMVVFPTHKGLKKAANSL